MRIRKLVLGLAIVCGGCESEAAKDLDAKQRYATGTAQACQKAIQNFQTVENLRDAMNKPEKAQDLRAYAKTVCREADKAQADLASPQS